jgi:very-short-patch-repair endonuclease
MKLDPAFTRREAERRLLHLIRTARLPAPQVNTTLEGYEVDFLWSAQRLVVETDGYAFIPREAPSSATGAATATSRRRATSSCGSRGAS